MRYEAISADGHVNEPPNLWVDRLIDNYEKGRFSAGSLRRIARS